MSYGQKKEDVYGSQTLYRELAYYITRREEYERALIYFDEAIKRAPTDKRALLGRSRARAKACQYKGALEDVAKALEQDSGDLIAVAYKALNTYLCCEFEDALVLNFRMVPIRKKPDNFTMGVMHCTEAIENGIGIRAGRPLRDHFKIIRRLGWKRSLEVGKPFEPKSKYKKKKKKIKDTAKNKKVVREPVVPFVRSKVSKSVRSMQSKYTEASSTVSNARNITGEEKELNTKDLDAMSALTALTEVADALGIQEEDVGIMDSLHTAKTESDYVPPGKPFPFRPIQRYTTNIENYMAEKYLDTMYLDKIFLKDLKNNIGVTSPNKLGARRIVQMSKIGYKTLAYKQELLRTRRPFYFIKYQEAKLSGALKERIEAELRKVQRAAEKDANSLLHKIIYAINAQQTRIALDTAEKLKIFCDSKSKKVLPLREDYLNQMYKLVSLAYYQIFRLSKKQMEWDREKRVYHFLGMPCSREPSEDSVLKEFKDTYVDWKKQIIIYEERLRKATSSEEMAWLYHELSRSHSELKQYELARVYARKCISEGRAAGSIYWVVNAMMMIAKINMQQHNRNDTKADLNEVLVVAKQIDDITLQEYIGKCLELVEKTAFDDQFAAKVLEKREQQIMQMMAGTGMKDEVSYLFRKMGVMPAARRMSVMPGVRLDDTGEKRTPASRKMSILPSAKQPEQQAPPSAMAHSTKKSDKAAERSTGIGFMELIKFHVD